MKNCSAILLLLQALVVLTIVRTSTAVKDELPEQLARAMRREARPQSPRARQLQGSGNSFASLARKGKGGKGSSGKGGKGGKGSSGKGGKGKSGKGGKGGKGSSSSPSPGPGSAPVPGPAPRPGPAPGSAPVPGPAPGPSPGPAPGSGMSPSPGSGMMNPAPGNGGCGGCTGVDVADIDFVMLPPTTVIPTAVAPIELRQAQDGIGAVYIFQDSLFDLNLTALNGTFVAGLCTRTQQLQVIGNNNTLVGAGYCQFTFTVSDGLSAVTFNAQGEIFDVLGGTLAINGGTGALRGAYGELELVPFYAETAQTDVFIEAALYVGAGQLIVPVLEG